MKDKKRHSRSYKTTEDAYKKAMRRAKKEKTPLAKMVEQIVEAYGEGAFTISFIKPLPDIQKAMK